jgi:hypothetical protein
MYISYIPKCLLEEESIVALKDMDVKLEETSLMIGRCKVNCIKVYNLTETQVFDKLESKAINEAYDPEKSGYASRCMSIIFMKVRQAQMIQDKDVRCAAVCSLLAAVNALAAIDIKTANRFLPLIRGIN